MCVAIGGRAHIHCDTRKQRKDDIEIACVHRRQSTGSTHHLTSKTIILGQCRIQCKSKTIKSTGHGMIQLGLIGKDGEHSSREWLADDRLVRLTDQQSWYDVELIANTNSALDEDTAGHAATQLLRSTATLVHTKAADHGDTSRHQSVALRLTQQQQSLQQVGEVPATLCRHGHHRSVFEQRTLEEAADLKQVLACGCLVDQIHLVLHHEHVRDAECLQGGHVLEGLRLRTGQVGGDHHNGRIHRGGTGEHAGHQYRVSGAVHEGDVSNAAHRTIAQRTVGSTLDRARRRGCGFIWVLVTLPQFRIRIAQFDGGSIVEFLLGVFLSTHTGETLDEGGFSVGDVTTDSDRDGGKQ
mmetsp:Transcript_11017/g.33737  ORF Transcript_11017/g.33737 Transcript_11017/m.33737 type:complete len:354 (-) Transcript_11017:313-1374(-)